MRALRVPGGIALAAVLSLSFWGLGILLVWHVEGRL